ncbi:EAL domain-containing protein [Xylella taiwanensis]|uniref:cyclic-guanylate-specific phosphodiesterase n=1 Tax=Xylella taiwanensis TaxID=1444770 RepID=Z9JME2_9GAMM|nr:EAL domain-containing protein [Xylella taiwanensis]AXI84096.1 diguanylate phosphodiesterase [Xylella taiwanensis]EWS78986.1 membrane protein [Xylella taiwanensis]MCD8457214.1 EAL domain-containing protein [Xylella taiwanensis]MCD8459624.1 EAL domain-containing protein [Xylella taiwanensis]MCD8461509.1 EAL domain-containing protein [Xylella taiwanensis]
MKRRWARIVGATLCIACLAVSVALADYYAWFTTQRHEQQRLRDLAQQLGQRVDQIVVESLLVLSDIEHSQLTPCSPEHITRMRALVLSTHYITELDYVPAQKLRCTSWGLFDVARKEPPANYARDDGLELVKRVPSKVNPEQRLLGLHHGNYHALMKLSTITDFSIPPGVELAVATMNGVLLQSTGAHVKALFGKRAGDTLHGLVAARIQNRDHDWQIAVIEPIQQLVGAVHRKEWRAIPLALLVSLSLCGFAILYVRRRRSPLTRLRQAVQRCEFLVCYQPIVSLSENRCVGAEALVRWRQHDGTLILPDQFIPLAERSGLILPITDQVVAESMRELGPLLVADRSLHVAINVSVRDIESGRVLEVLKLALQGSGVCSEQIWIEATERSFMDACAAREHIVRLREAGYAVVIDDFGTGYSSLQYLQQLPLDVLKIDKSFIDTVGRDANNTAVASHIIDIAKELGMRTIAEGVEREEQLVYLRARGVDMAQGWLFSRPLSAPGFADYLARNRSMQPGC